MKIINNFVIPFFIIGICYIIGNLISNTFFSGTITGIFSFALVQIIKVYNNYDK